MFLVLMKKKFPERVPMNAVKQINIMAKVKGEFTIV